MWNIGLPELAVLALVGLIVLGPEKLPGFARDAARMLRTLRELATGARQQLRDELGPEFADVDFRNLNPRTAITKAVFGDDPPDLQKYNPRNFDLRASANNLLNGGDEPGGISMTKDAPSANGVSHVNGAGHANGSSGVNGSAPEARRPRPRPRPRGYEDDAT